ncbi:MAG: ABC transporter substrate-binding protein, partial [Trebonia sp.]
SGSGDSSHARVLGHAKSGIVNIGVAQAPTNINPLDSGSEVTRWIAEPVVETLYAYDDNLNSVPLLAVGEPTISADKLTWTFRLKPGVTWHNGDPLTADDLAATFEHISALANGSEWIVFTLGYVERWKVVDSLTFEVVLSRPYGLLRTVMTNLPVSHRGYTDRKDAMMGTGPFKLDGYNPGQSFTMSAYPGYHGAKPALKGIVYTVFGDDATRLVAIQQGTVDMITNVPYGNLKKAQSNQNLVVSAKRAPLDIMWYTNCKKAPFSDVNFRTALAYAIDRQGIADRVFGGAAMIGQGPVGPGELGYNPALSRFKPGPDFATARQYLAKAATAQRSFTLSIPVQQTEQDLATILAAGWSQIGVTAQIQPLSGELFSQAITGVTYDLLMSTYQSGFTCGNANYTILSAADPTNVVSCGFEDKQTQQLTATAWQTSDDAARARALADINAITLADSVMFPPVYPKTVVATRRELTPVDTSLLAVSRISPQRLAFRR